MPTVGRSFTAKDLEEHYVWCGHRFSGEESSRVLVALEGKFGRNPMKTAADGAARVQLVQRKRQWTTRGMYRERGQRLMERYCGNPR